MKLSRGGKTKILHLIGQNQSRVIWYLKGSKWKAILRYCLLPTIGLLFGGHFKLLVKKQQFEIKEFNKLYK